MRWCVTVAVLILLSAGSMCEARLTQSTLRTGNLTEAGEIVLRVRDNLSGVDPSSIRLVIDGREVTPSLSLIPKGYSVSYTPAEALTGEYKVEICARDMAKNSMRQAYRFMGAPFVAANPRKSNAGPECNRPMLRRAADNESSLASVSGACWGPRPVSERHDAAAGPGKRLIARPGLMSAHVLPDTLFNVAIMTELRATDGRELYHVTFDVKSSRDVDTEYELFVGLIEPSGEVVFYEPEAGRRGVALKELEQVGDSWFELNLSFEPGELLGQDYTWCAVVARAGSGGAIVSNVASALFDGSRADSDTVALDESSTFP